MAFCCSHRSGRAWDQTWRLLVLIMLCKVSFKVAVKTYRVLAASMLEEPQHTLPAPVAGATTSATSATNNSSSSYNARGSKMAPGATVTRVCKKGCLRRGSRGRAMACAALRATRACAAALVACLDHIVAKAEKESVPKDATTQPPAREARSTGADHAWAPPPPAYDIGEAKRR